MIAPEQYIDAPKPDTFAQMLIAGLHRAGMRGDKPRNGLIFIAQTLISCYEQRGAENTESRLNGLSLLKKGEL